VSTVENYVKLLEEDITMSKYAEDEAVVLEFSLTEEEQVRAKEFMEEHYIADRDSLGANRVQFEFVFMATMIGNFITIRDRKTGDEQPITSMDKF